MEERVNKQENVRDYLRENEELISRIDCIVSDDLRTITGAINAPGCCELKIGNEDRSILDQCLLQNDELKTIIKTLEETRSKLIG